MPRTSRANSPAKRQKALISPLLLSLGSRPNDPSLPQPPTTNLQKPFLRLRQTTQFPSPTPPLTPSAPPSHPYLSHTYPLKSTSNLPPQCHPPPSSPFSPSSPHPPAQPPSAPSACNRSKRRRPPKRDTSFATRASSSGWMGVMSGR